MASWASHTHASRPSGRELAQLAAFGLLVVAAVVAWWYA